MKTHTIEHIDTKGNRRIVVLRVPGGYRIDEFERRRVDDIWRYRRFWETGMSRQELNSLLVSIW
jgi:hypothetical protein